MLQVYVLCLAVGLDRSQVSDSIIPMREGRQTDNFDTDTLHFRTTFLAPGTEWVGRMTQFHKEFLDKYRS